ncbi:MAG: class I SAM-dependent methyltransferase, partial [Pseudonocardiaceae bacterium]
MPGIDKSTVAAVRARLTHGAAISGKSVPTPLKQVAKQLALATAFLWDPVHIAWFRHSRGWQGPVPPFPNRWRVGAWRAPYYFAHGKDCQQDLGERLVRYTGQPLSDLTVLDLACGPGRIAQFFDGQLASLSACDVDQSAIAYLRKYFPRINARANQSDQPLPFGAASFDVVYSWSLWTHLREDAQQRYLEELHRVLRPGGWAFLTTNGHRWLDDYQAYPRAEPYWLSVSHDDISRHGLL